MKLARALTVFALAALFAYPVIAHHAAQDIIDEELWNMIDEMVADTPHATIDLDGMGSDGVDRLGFSVNQVPRVENLVEDGLLELIGYLDGEVSLTIDFLDHNQIYLEIAQIPPEEAETDGAKSAGTVESVNLDELKASYR
jgi:hypothetical protein